MLSRSRMRDRLRLLANARRRTGAAHLLRRAAVRLDPLYEEAVAAAEPQPLDGDPRPDDPMLTGLPLRSRERAAHPVYREIRGASDPSHLPGPWPLEPPPGHRGQLDPEAQRRLRALFEPIEADRCHWYHEIDLGDGTRIPGGWDLIGGERDYLGGVNLEGVRLLELGPASGYLSFWMEQQGADVVAFDVGFDTSVDLIRFGDEDVATMRADAMRFVAAVERSWWSGHDHFDSKARMVYGDVYSLPDDLGRFTTATFGSILLHLRDPFRALTEVARYVDHTIVVTERVPPHDLRGCRLLHFNPVEHDRSSWWLLSPSAIARMLATLGFARQRIIQHVQFVRTDHDVTFEPHPVELYTIVAERD